MSKYIDLHIHSCNSSDGLLTPEEIIRKAKENDFRTIAIADHDTVKSVNDALFYGKQYEIEVIPAIEVTTQYNRRFYHILAYYFNLSEEHINLLIQELIKRRRDKNLFRIQKLSELGLIVPEEIIILINKGELIVGPTLSKAIIEDSRNKYNVLINKLRKEDSFNYSILFYRRIIKGIDMNNEQQQWLSTLDAIKMIRRGGSIPVLAHPGADLFYADQEVIKMLKESGLLGIEVYSTYHSVEQIIQYREIANRLNLLITGGSDYHGKVKPHISFGAVKIDDYSIVDNLKEAYFQGLRSN